MTASGVRRFTVGVFFLFFPLGCACFSWAVVASMARSLTVPRWEDVAAAPPIPPPSPIGIAPNGEKSGFLAKALVILSRASPKARAAARRSRWPVRRPRTARTSSMTFCIVW